MALWKNDQWQALKEKTDYKTDARPEDFANIYPANRTVKRWISFKVQQNRKGNNVATEVVSGKRKGNEWINFEIMDTTMDQYPGGYGLGVLAQRYKLQYANNTDEIARKIGNTLTENGTKNREDLNKRATVAAEENNKNLQLNQINSTLNNWSQEVINKANTGPTGSYLKNRNEIENYTDNTLASLINSGAIDQSVANTLKGLIKDSYKNYYTEKRLKSWDGANQGLQPPVGGFDAAYYISQGNKDGDLNTQWEEARLNDDLDIIGRYGSKDDFAWNHYSTVGKAAGYRGNPSVETEYVNDYKESFDTLTDAEKQFIREGQLGLIPQNKGYVVDWEDNTGSFLEGKVETGIGEQKLKAEDKFGALTVDLLKNTVEKLKETKAKERELDIYNTLPGFSEVYNINSSLANTLLADSGLGGYLGMTGVNTKQFQRDLEDKLSGYTGVSNNYATYDWNKWFDEELKERYDNIKSIDGTLAANTQYNLDEKYKQNFINNYIKPRFDQSKSMDEFIGYLSTTQDGENVYDVSDASNAVKNLASEQAAKYYSDLQNRSSVGFSPSFYANPDQSGVNEAKKLRYANQKTEFEEDWRNAKQNGNSNAGNTGRSWDDWAYYYGIDVNQKDQFARLHYEIIGRQKGFDPAKDVVTQGDISDFIDNKVLNSLNKVDWDSGKYLNFVTPEELADSVIKGIDPKKNKTAFNKLLDVFGLDENTEMDTLKDYLTDSFSTGEARQMRESIAYLNQQKLKPTQRDLGVSYIERDTDQQYKADPEADDLYNLFSSAGYGGSAEDFYTSFMPDVDRSSLQLISKARKGGLSLKNINTSDPFQALSDINEIFGGDDEDIFGTKTTTTTPKKEVNYFDLFGSKEKEASDKKSSLGFDTNTDYYSDMLSLFN